MTEQENVRKTISELRDADFINAIFDKEWKPFFVGGYVRDFLLNKKSHDIDIIVTGVEKEDLINLLNNFGYCDLVGESFAVIKFKHNEIIYDISTPRTEKKIGSGHKGFEVISNKNISLEDDLFRRDITINSIAMDFDLKFIDPFNGLDDLKKGIIKITNPDAFIDDPLRINRAIRFSARLDFIIEKETRKLMLNSLNHLKEISKERFHEEFEKVIDHAEHDISIMQRFIDLLTEFNMWDEMFEKGLDFNTNIVVDVLSKSFIMFDLFSNISLTSKFRKKMIRTFKFKAETLNEMIFLSELIDFVPENIFDLTKLRERFHIEKTFIEKAITHFNLDEGLIKSFISFSNIGFLTDGNDLIKQGFEGKERGIEMRRLETERFFNEFF